MSEPWIRVHAILIDKPVVARAVEALGVDEHAAVGLLVTFWGAVARNVVGGHIAAATDAQLELWARWRGKRGRFAAFIRGHHIDPDGRVNEWDEYAGALENRREKERTRLYNKRHGIDQQPHNGTHDVAQQSASVATRAPERNGTERNGSTNPPSALESSSLRSGSVAAAAPPENVDEVLKAEPVRRFLNTYYRTATPARVRDVQRQVLATLTRQGARHPQDPNARVKAFKPSRLFAACDEVVDEGVRDRDKAIVVLLIKLHDTDDLTEQASIDTKAEIEQDDLARKRDIADARVWLGDNPLASLPEVTAEQFKRLQATTRGVAQLLEYELRLLDAWRQAGSPRAARTA